MFMPSLLQQRLEKKRENEQWSQACWLMPQQYLIRSSATVLAASPRLEAFSASAASVLVPATTAARHLLGQ
jgi:hypothetical protein